MYYWNFLFFVIKLYIDIVFLGGTWQKVLLPNKVMIDFSSLENPKNTNKIQSIDSITNTIESLTQEEYAQVVAFSQKIDLHNNDIIINYGKTIQRQSAALADKTLNAAKSIPYSDVMLSVAQLIYAVNKLTGNVDSNGIVSKFFNSIKNRFDFRPFDLNTTKATIDLIEKKIVGHTLYIEKDIQTLNKIYDENIMLYKSLTLYIKAAELAIERSKKELERMKKEASATGNKLLLLNADGYANQIEMFEQKLYDIRLTRTVCLQYAPQIKMIQNNDMLLLMRLQSSIVNTLPIWKRDIFLAIESKNSMDIAKNIGFLSDKTNSSMHNNNSFFAENMKNSKNKLKSQNMIDAYAVESINNQIIDAAYEYMETEEQDIECRTNAQKIIQNSEATLKNKFSARS